MRLIVLSGGSGKRLWPLSNDYRSKQFIKVMDSDTSSDESTDEYRTSMIQRVWAKLQEHNLAESAVIAASRAQQEIIQSQIGAEVPLVLEPTRRDTFPAICLASSFLHSRMSADDDEIIVVMPVDVEADDSFYSSIKQLAQLFQTSSANLGLIGLKPTHPSEKFGYILTNAAQEQATLLNIDRFVEKPSIEEASELIENGALWNCGVFAFRLGYILRLLDERSLPKEYGRLSSQYHLLPAISFDYQIVERENNIVVHPYQGNWSDLGTWNDWTETMPNRMNGKGILSDDCENTCVINELQIPIVVMGVSNAIIAASPDGILVVDRSVSSKIKDVIQDISARPMYQETEYGWCRVIDEDNQQINRQVVTKKVQIWAGKHISYHVHAHRNEIWTLISGKAEIVVDERQFIARSGDIIHVQAGSKHAIKAIEAVNLIEVQIGEKVDEEDITRYDIDWNDYKLSWEG
ncbi:sugar phosphate nucleotidyltransferase [Cohnella herbarum]|uniref:Cupin domain-containing protein n=1 Tax=Cohnella herbarum TaxID=2728023 RepID=A0A7Z2VMK0_9BACL|nr:sugar phosphate nucleotidyltransferase [Cohnella herbarum]QJD86028.1 cupin domain-containing protein [Cohnella herbarum]